jgi:hypothetical protein
MKQPIFILSSLLCMFSTCPVAASDSLEEEPIVPVVEEAPVDNIQVSDAEYMRETMDEIVKTRARVDELLVPCESSQNLWTGDVFATNSNSFQMVATSPMATSGKTASTGFSLGEQNYYGETVYIINNFLAGAGDNVSSTDGAYIDGAMLAEYDDCPFNTVSECAIWARKPTISEVVAPRSPALRDSVMCEVADAIEQNPNISANAKVMTPLLSRYQVLMRASQSCCTGGITYKLKQAGATQGLIYKFLSDDANFSGFSMNCLVMSDNDIEQTQKYEATSAMIGDIRNECLCKSKATFRALLAPFEQLYSEYPQFADAPFAYSHYDGVGRAVTDYINVDVQNVLHQLEMCP